LAYLVSKPSDQPGLADTGLPGHAERDGIADPGGLEGGVEAMQLSCATYEMRGRNGPRHGDEYAPHSLGWELVGRSSGWKFFSTRHRAAIT
jgi:hypothetical protein